MKNSPVLSICVAAYNLENRLERCLDSLAKSIRHLPVEVIVIDDGSTDTTGQVADTFANSQGEYWRVVHKKNGGLSSVRNLSIELSRAEYVWFVDGDDTIPESAVPRIYEAITANPDTDLFLLEMDMIRPGELAADKSVSVLSSHSRLNAFPRNEVCHFTKYPELIVGYATGCARVTKKQILRKIPNGFLEGVWYEDLDFMTRLWLNVDTVMALSGSCYTYITEENSIMRNKNISKNLDLIKVFENVFEYYRERGCFEKYYHELEFVAIDNIIYAAGLRLAKMPNSRSVRSELYSYISTSFPNWSRNPYFLTTSWKRRLLSRVLYHKIPLPDFVLK